MIPIGGYPELAIEPGKHFHNGALRLNLGRTCLEYILKVRGYSKVFLPHYTCSVLLEPLRKSGVEAHYYDIDFNFEAVFLPKLNESEAFLYINYLGLKDKYVELLYEKYGKRLIVDNSQAFYSDSISGVDTFYSARKFFGVSDGAYLYCDAIHSCMYPQDYSYDRMMYLLKRIDVGAENGYADFQTSEESLSESPIMKMSKLTSRILEGIDYSKAKECRKRNFMILHEALRDCNMLDFEISESCAPLAYPFLQSDSALRAKLIDRKIFVPKYWPEFNDGYSQTDSEKTFRKLLLPLPIMHTYDRNDMHYIIETIKSVTKQNNR